MRLAVGVNVAIAVIALAIAAVGLVPVNGHSHPDISIAVGVPLFLFLVLLYSATGRRGVVTGDSLVLKKSRWARPQAIPLGAIEAVGMVYTVQPRISGWRNYCWRADGEPLGLPVGLCAAPAPQEPGALDHLEGSRQGEICREVFRRVVDYQGADGLAARDRVTMRRGNQRAEKAYWSANPAIAGINLIPGHE